MAAFDSKLQLLPHLAKHLEVQLIASQSVYSSTVKSGNRTLNSKAGRGCLLEPIKTLQGCDWLPETFGRV